MEPTSYPNNTFNTAEQPPISPVPWWKKRRNIVIGIVLLIIAVVLGIALSGGSNDKKNDDNDDVSNAKFYHDREGFDRSKLSDGIGDPAPLSMVKSGAQPATYQGTTVVPACNVLSISDITKHGLRVRPNQLTGDVTRNYFDGQGTGTLMTNSFSLNTDYDGNNCSYVLEDTKSLDVDVFQSPYNDPESLDYEIGRRYSAMGQVGGFSAYKRASDDLSYFMLRSGANAVQLTFRDLDSSKHNQLLETAAANFSRLLNSPEAPYALKYESPLLKKPAIVACELLKGDDIQQLYGTPASPTVTERAGSAVGVLQFDLSGGGSVVDNYVSTECIRRPAKTEADVNRFAKKSVSLAAQAFMSEEGAKQDMISSRPHHKDAQAVSGIGDEAFFGTFVSDVLVVRQGSTIMTVGVQNSTIQMTKQQNIGYAKSIAQKVLDRMR